MHPWVPVEPWEPGDLGIPVMRRPEGREARAHYLPRRHVSGNGARMRLQGRGDHASDRWLYRADPARRGASPIKPTAFQNLMVDRQRLHVRLATAVFRFDGRGHDRQFRRRRSSLEGVTGRADEIITAEAAPRSGARGAKALGGREQYLPTRPSRPHVAVEGRRAAIAPTRTCAIWSPGQYRLPWEDEVVHMSTGPLMASRSRRAVMAKPLRRGGGVRHAHGRSQSLRVAL